MPLQRGLRQECPFSQPLFVIQGEVTTIKINNNKSITDIHISNKIKQLKISQYADESNLFLKNQESVNVLNFFEKLNKTTGTTINLEKTTVLPINTDHISQIQNNTQKITIKNN